MSFASIGCSVVRAVAPRRVTNERAEATTSILSFAKKQFVQQLKREEAERKQVDPALPARLAQDRMLIEQRFARLGDAPFSFELAGSRGLVEAGVAALVALLTKGS